VVASGAFVGHHSKGGFSKIGNSIEDHLKKFVTKTKTTNTNVVCLAQLFPIKTKDGLGGTLRAVLW
jgi:hypothetical protein